MEGLEQKEKMDMKRWWILKIEGKNGRSQPLLEKISEMTNPYKEEEKSRTKNNKKGAKRVKKDTK